MKRWNVICGPVHLSGPNGFCVRVSWDGEAPVTPIPLSATDDVRTDLDRGLQLTEFAL